MASSNIKSYVNLKNLLQLVDFLIERTSSSITVARVLLKQVKENSRNLPGPSISPQKSVSVQNIFSEKDNSSSYFFTLYTNISGKSIETPKPLPKWKSVNKTVVSTSSINSRTRNIIQAIVHADDNDVLLKRIETLCEHVHQFPETKSTASKRRAIPLLLRIRQNHASDEVGIMAREALALLGHNDPVKGWGIRLLSIDGGGTRGIATLEILRKLESLTGKPISHLFDFICGVSTGAVIAMLLGPLKKAMDEAEEIYRTVSLEAFNQSSFRGTSGLLWSHSYYNTDDWVKILKKHIGESPLICTARDPDCPKVAAVSTIMNIPHLSAFVFRNYATPVHTQSRYLGGNTDLAWEAVRASAAAPGYFEEFRLGDYLHQDGGILMNNPTSLAIHECHNLWPGVPFQCVVSCGTGRVHKWEEPSQGFSSLKTKMSKILDSATDTEAVHATLHDLLPGSVYFRLNPYLSETLTLDEVRPEKLEQLKEDTQMYLRRNELKLKEAAKALLQTKGKLQACKEWLNYQATMRL